MKLCGYTQHTVLYENMERAQIVPIHMKVEIIEEFHLYLLHVIFSQIYF